MRREHRRELKHDRFVDGAGSLWSKAGENQRLLIIAGTVVIAVGLGIYGFFVYRNTREQKAQQALSAAADVLNSPLIPPPGGALQPDAKYKTEAERNAAAFSDFQKVEQQYGGTDAADVAKLYLARLDAGRGDVTDSSKLLEDFIHAHPQHVLVGTARFSLYQLRIENGEAAQVASELQSEIAKPNPVLPVDTLLLLEAHAFDAQGKAVKSKEAYRRIVTEFPDSPYALEAQRRVGPA